MGRKIGDADPGSPAELGDKLAADRLGVPIHLEVFDILSLVYPIGCVYLAAVASSPALLLGFGVWEQIAQGRALFGQNEADADFDTAEETGGAKTSAALLAHTHGVTDPGHNHTQNAHTHVQDAHTHVQDSHNHTQNPHQHGMPEGTTDGSGTFADRSNAAAAASMVTDNATAVNQAATATNQNATAVNQAATAINQSGVTGVVVDSAGSGASFSILPPYFVIFAWKRIS